MACTSTQTAPSSVPPPPSSSFRLLHDAFISFRGKDTRSSFTSHLYAALVHNGISAYLDDTELERGEAIEPSLWKAIEDSRISIVVFSKGYAFSTWCLDELVKIVECMNEMGQIVFPIFHDVDPSDVAELRGDYGRAFVKHEQDVKENLEKVQRWRNAIIQVANLSGWDTRNRNESKIIGEVIDKILGKLSPTFSSINKYLVGMHSRVRAMLDMLSERINDVRTIGIYGMGGIGKTTIARVVYDKIYRKFEGSCFIANVREVFEQHGPRPLQEQLLSEILRQLNAKIWDAGRGTSEIKRRLRYKKVLIVIDDMNDLEQLRLLAIENNSFGLGSRIIITTRDKHLLDAHGVDGTYKVEQLNDDDAFTLFSQKAFKKDKPAEEYNQLSKCIVGYCQGLPLALEVLGSFLRCRKKDIWESAIRRLNKIPHNEIINVLRISFDGLEELEKQIFLDIACFFNGMEENQVIKILDYFGFEPVIGIQALADKSLISIGFGRLRMHDLLQIMGREIVRQECPEEPGRRSRLWSFEDAFHVLTKNTGGEKVEAIVVNLPVVDELKIQQHHHVAAFSKMRRLRLLIIPNLHLKEGALYPFDELRYLKLHYCTSKSLPSCFQLENLCELDMSYSSVKKLWHGKKSLHNLTVINLSYCEKLIKTPDLSETLNLERLILQGCTSLSDIHPSIRHLTKLVHVNLVHCSKIKKFSDIFKNMECLQQLLLDGTRIEKIPTSNQHPHALVELSLRDCKNLKSLPSYIDGLKSLRRLDVSRCSKIKKFPDIVGNMESLVKLYLDQTGIEELPSSSFQRFPGLVELSLRNCKNFKSLPSSINGLKSLKTLDVYGCSKLENVPESLGEVESLVDLFASGTAIRQPPVSIFRLKNLDFLDFSGCWGESSKSIAGEIANPTTLVLSSFSGLHSLTVLNLSNCNLGDEDIPNDLGCLASLWFLNLSNNNFVSLPRSISQLSRLGQLLLEECKMLQSLPVFPNSMLSDVSVRSCYSLEKVSVTESNESSSICFNGENCFKLCDQDGDGDCAAFTMLKMFLLQYLHDGVSSKRNRIHMVVPGSEIPAWFTYKSKGNSVRIPSLDSLNGYNNSEWIGIAACVVLSPSSKQTEDKGYTFHCYCQGSGNDTLSYLCCVSFRGIGSDHLWLLYSLGGCQGMHMDLAEPPHCVQFSARWENNEIKVIKCGYRPVYREDIEELSGGITQDN